MIIKGAVQLELNKDNNRLYIFSIPLGSEYTQAYEVLDEMKAALEKMSADAAASEKQKTEEIVS